MKVVLVVYSNAGLTLKEINDQKMKKYCFRTEEDLQPGDIIISNSYSTPMIVTDVIEHDYQYYNATTGELSCSIKSTSCYPIKKLVIKEDEDMTIYATYKYKLSE